MIYSRYFLLFIVYSVIGWIFESIYCTIHDKCWENRGFLYGPVIPIYGVGATAITVLVHMLMHAEHAELPPLQIFLICFFGSMVLEYSTHWALEKLFHACWWDYSNLPLNINGRICLPASLLFGLSGLGVIYGLNPILHTWSGEVSDLSAELGGMLMLVIFVMDATLTISALTNFEIHVRNAEQAWNDRMESAVNTAYTKTAGAVDAVQTKTAAAIESAQTRTAGAVSAVQTKTVAAIESAQTRTAGAVSVVQTKTAAAIESAQTRTAGAVSAVQTKTAAAIETAQTRTAAALGNARMTQEAYTSEAMKSIAGNMSAMHQSAIRRIKKVRVPGNPLHRELSECTHLYLKRHRSLDEKMEKASD